MGLEKPRFQTVFERKTQKPRWVLKNQDLGGKTQHWQPWLQHEYTLQDTCACAEEACIDVRKIFMEPMEGRGRVGDGRVEGSIVLLFGVRWRYGVISRIII